MKYSIVIVFLFLSLSGFGQQSLSLNEALRLGLLNNLGIHIADQNVELAESEKRIFRATTLPRIGFSARQNNLYEVDNSPTSFVDGNYTQSSAKASLDASWTLFDGFKAKLDAERLNQLSTRSSGAAQMVVENTSQAIVVSYYRAILEHKKLQVIQEVTKQSKDRYSRSSLLFENGSSSLFDLLRLEQSWIKDSINHINQEVIQELALDELKFLVGIKSSSEITLSDQLDKLSKNYLLSVLQDNLVSNNQDIKMQYLNLELQAISRKKLEADRYPTIKLNSALSQDISSSKFVGEDKRRGSSFDFFAGFTIDYALYNGGRTKELLKKNKIQERIALLEIEQLERRLQDELKDTYDRYVNYQSVIAKQNELLKVIQLTLSIAKDRLDGGYATPLEYRSLQLDYLETNMDLLETVFNLKTAEVTMTRLTGGISRSSF